MNILGFNREELISLGGYYTATEIAGQSGLWLKTFKLFSSQKLELQLFLEKFLSEPNLQIILSGAGTSAFIGEAIEGVVQKISGINTRAIATTDIVSHPELYFLDKTVLMISFARSGNSPESVEAVKLAEKLCLNIFHLFVTCNPDGELALRGRNGKDYVFLLPPEADDKSLAMTGSFSSMMLSGLLIANLINGVDCQRQVILLSEAAHRLLNNYLEDIKNIATLQFNRAVFLGSGPMMGVARESHLKLQELTDGKVICKHDSFLGFRHGPKAVVNENTILVFLLSNNPYVLQYEKDLIDAVNNGEKGRFRIAVLEQDIEDVNVDLKIIIGNEKAPLKEEFLAIVQVLVAQLIGFYKSLNFGLKPDTPSESGTITRVVKGVNIYPYLKKEESLIGNNGK